MIHTARRAEPVNGDRANGTAHDTATEGQDMTDTTPTPQPLDLDLDQRVAFERMDEYARGHWGGQMLADWDSILAEVEALRTERDKARQQLADAPHGAYCPARIGSKYMCSCWKGMRRTGGTRGD